MLEVAKNFALEGTTHKTHTKMRQRRLTVTMTSADLRWRLKAVVVNPIQRRATHSLLVCCARGLCR